MCHSHCPKKHKCCSQRTSNNTAEGTVKKGVFVAFDPIDDSVMQKKFYPNENNLEDMKKYKKILDEKLKNKKMGKLEHKSIIKEVNNQIEKLLKKVEVPKKSPVKKVEEKKDEKYVYKYLRKNFPYLTKIYLGDKRYDKYTIWKDNSGELNKKIIKFIFDNKREEVEKMLMEKLALYIRGGGGCYHDLSNMSTNINQFKIEIDPSKNNIIHTLKYHQDTIKEFNDAYNECTDRAIFFKKTLPNNIYENSKIQDSIKHFLKKYNEFVNSTKMKNVKKKIRYIK